MKTITIGYRLVLLCRCRNWRRPPRRQPTSPAPPAKPQVAAKNLHGAALTSSAKKCCEKTRQRRQSCTARRPTSFTKKCVSDATAAPKS